MLCSSGVSSGWSKMPASSSRQSIAAHPADVVDDQAFAQTRCDAEQPLCAGRRGTGRSRPAAGRTPRRAPGTWRLPKGTSSGHHSTTGRSWISSGATAVRQVLRQLAARPDEDLLGADLGRAARGGPARGVDVGAERGRPVRVAGRDDDRARRDAATPAPTRSTWHVRPSRHPVRRRPASARSCASGSAPRGRRPAAPPSACSARRCESSRSALPLRVAAAGPARPGCATRAPDLGQLAAPSRRCSRRAACQRCGSGELPMTVLSRSQPSPSTPRSLDQSIGGLQVPRCRPGRSTARSPGSSSS